MTDKWVYRRVRESATMRLFCFPYAGAGASVYGQWQADLPEQIEVCAVELPGRRARSHLPLIRRVEPLAAAVANGLAPYLDLPYALMGHSFGALVAYELYHRLRDLPGVRPPSALIISGTAAPHVRRRQRIAHLPDPEFLAEIRTYGGIPDPILAEPEFIDVFLPVLRADFEAFEHYQPGPYPPVTCPLHLCGGRHDPLATPAQVAAWADLAAGPVTTDFFDGGHFYLNDRRKDLTTAIAHRLTQHLPDLPLPAVER